MLSESQLDKPGALHQDRGCQKQLVNKRHQLDKLAGISSKTERQGGKLWSVIVAWQVAFQRACDRGQAGQKRKLRTAVSRAALGITNRFADTPSATSGRLLLIVGSRCWLHCGVGYLSRSPNASDFSYNSVRSAVMFAGNSELDATSAVLGLVLS
jgi:hypothetical protein